MEPTERRRQQREIDTMLKWGIVFSLIWLAGIGSSVAFLLGLRARKRINASNQFLVGTGRVWWCLLVGGFGMILWLPLLMVGIANHL